MPDTAVETRPAARPAKSALPLELEILELFGRSGLLTIGPTDAEKLTGVSKGATSARMKALADAGYLQAVGGGRYLMGPRVFQMAMAYMAQTMQQVDESQRLLNCNLSQLRSGLQLLAGAMPGQTREEEQ
jgi:DNA-binding IclR family transcriptional regulator